MSDTPLILLAAGGTGGHLFPAEALGVELIQRGLRVRLATDARALRYSGLFTPENIDVVPSETVRGRNPVSLARTAFLLGYGTLVAANLVRRLKPCRRGRLRRLSDGAAIDGRKTARHTQRHSRRQRGAWPRQSLSLRPRQRDRDLAARRARSRSCIWPARPPPSARRCARAVLAAAAVPFASPESNGPLRLLVVGGSQGARVMSDIVPPAIERLEPALWSRLVADAAGARRRHGAGSRGL